MLRPRNIFALGLAALGLALGWVSCLSNPPGVIAPCPPPLFQEFSPRDGAEDVPLDADLSIDLRAPVDPSTLPPETFVLTLGDDTIPGTLTYDPSDTSLVFDPLDSLLPDTTYTVTFTPEIDDPFGNPLDTVLIWTFTTTEDEPDFPGIDVFPADSAVDVPVDVVITVDFDTPLDTAWLDSNAVVVTSGPDTIPGTLTYDDTTLVFTPDDSLPPETPFTVTVTVPTDSQSVMGPIDTTFTWTFTTTDSLPKGPKMEYPGDGAVNIPYPLKLWWFKVTGATSYRVQVSLSSTFATTILDSTSASFDGNASLHNVLAPLVPNKLHYWRVNATNSWGTGPWSATWSFKTKP